MNRGQPKRMGRRPLSRLAHRALRIIVPAHLRATHGRDMEETFISALTGANSHRRRAALWLRELSDFVRTRRTLENTVARSRLTHHQGQRRGGSQVVDDLVHGLRSLGRAPSFTLFAAVTIGLGVGATTAIYSALDRVILNPLPYEDGDRMVSLFRRFGDSGSLGPPSLAQVEAWAELDVFEAVEPWRSQTATLSGTGEALEVETVGVQPSFLEMLGRSTTLGRWLDEDDATEEAKVAVLSHAMWRTRFGSSRDVLGKDITLDGESWTVVGVMEPKTLLPGWGLQRVDVWKPLVLSGESEYITATAVFADGQTLDQVNEQMKAVGDGVGGTSGRPDWYGVANLVKDQVANGLQGTMGLLMGAVVFLLLIACVNVSNLLLARATKRQKETSIRVALGAARRRLVRQTLLESLLLSGLGAVFGLGISIGVHRVIALVRPERLEILDQVQTDGRVFVFAVAVAASAGIIFGVLPALRAGVGSIASPLGSRSQAGLGPRDGRLRWALVTGEIGLSFALLLGSFSLLNVLVGKAQQPIGFDADRVASISISLPVWRYASEDDREQIHERIFDRITALPGVGGASRSSGAPPRAGIMIGTAEVEGKPVEAAVSTYHGPWVDPSYFETLGLRIVQGAGFSEAILDAYETPVVVGETLAEELAPEGDIVGLRFRLDGESWMTVVGVAEDIAMNGLSNERSQFQVYRPMEAGWEYGAITVRANPDVDPRRLLQPMRDVVRQEDGDIRVDLVGTATSLMRGTLERERFSTSLMGGLAGLALILSCIGLIGVVSQVVGQRTREIGIRMALGATRNSIVHSFLRTIGWAAGAGIALGVVLSVGGYRILRSFVPVTLDPGVLAFVGAAGVLAFITLLAGFVPAQRAASIDPLHAMDPE